jgi:hypothetical protein
VEPEVRLVDRETIINFSPKYSHVRHKHIYPVQSKKNKCLVELVSEVLYIHPWIGHAKKVTFVHGQPIPLNTPIAIEIFIVFENEFLVRGMLQWSNDHFALFNS